MASPPPRVPDILVLDLDGTVYLDDALVPGAKRAIELCRGASCSLRFASNTTRMSRSALLTKLASMGLEIPPAELLTAPVAAAKVLRECGVRRVMPLLPSSTWEDLVGIELVDAEAEVVLVGDLGTGFTFEVLNAAFQQLLRGARLYACHRNRYWRVGGGFLLDAGAFVAALEYAAGCTAELVGKPSPKFFAAAVGSPAAAPEAARPVAIVVGDDLDSDIAGAYSAGYRSALVQTGKYRPEELARARPQPDWVLESIADLPWLLGLDPDRPLFAS